MPTIAGIASSNANFNILVSALGFVDAQLPGSNLVQTLNTAGANLTVFAPTDAAFGQLAKDLGYTGAATNEGGVTSFLTIALTPQTLRDVILYHVSAGAKTAAQVQAANSITTLNGVITPDGTTLIDREPDLINPTLVQTNIHASNGIIHAIDRVLLPINLPGNTAPTITGIVAASGSYDTNANDFDLLLSAVKAAGLADALNNPAADLTVFAPTDGAFLSLAKTLGYAGTTEKAAFDYLVDALTLLSGGESPIPLLKNILLYHVAPESLQASQVLSATTIKTLLGVDLGVSGTSLVDKEPDLANPNLIKTDIQAANGVVHVIDKVLLPVNILPTNGEKDVRFIVASDNGTRILGGRDNDFIDANGGNDLVFSGRGNDVVLGGAGDDRVFAGAGNDLVRGDAGNDLLFGDKGNDTIHGGAGRDVIFGGAGADVFVFATGSGRDLVLDFTNGTDKLDLSGYGIKNFAGLTGDIKSDPFGTNIDLGHGNVFTLEGVTKAQIDANDFLFA